MMAFPIVIIMPVLLLIGMIGTLFTGLISSGGNPITAIEYLIGFFEIITQ